MFMRSNAARKHPLNGTSCASSPIPAEVFDIKLTCPQCGQIYAGSADEIVNWRNQHQCPRASRPPRIRGFRRPTTR